MLERAQKQGKKVGNVSTAEITDATPAVLDSHISLRGCQGPADTDDLCPTETKAAGGLGSIAEQTVDHQRRRGARRRARPLRRRRSPAARTPARRSSSPPRARATPRSTTRAGLARCEPLGPPLLGLFNAGNMTTEWNGPVATRGDGTPAQRCTTDNRPANEPSLPAMTHEGDRPARRATATGFFLQVEGASIDKQDHAANACAQIGETVAFDNAIGVALDYQRTHPDTLIVVTADHAHTSQIVGEDTTGTGNPTGYSNNLITEDGQTMRITYGTAGGATPPAAPPSQQHTGSVVPIWGAGPGAAAVLGTTDHTDLFEVLGGGHGRRLATEEKRGGVRGPAHGRAGPARTAEGGRA